MKPFDKKLADEGFNNVAIDIIKRVIEDICTVCWDNAKGCQCWNDE